ncbi:uncharacterized protein PGTG_21718 [Puccinia graminis f. sp. tritici CRL 75-36-700-3]|uniref:Uncharacterized protein n=1 Tax=Puccinia graminis f. sp. tritici (strain CRL 75-36-700-3 / race SCCL) TaxID=418459 RepID=H6QSA2_PUCGT|nr:uncharacterized protein PGTG_21718 [Puccinia graminis f. sp. tritici CRL 75-36-700-3]EHS63626.1 hypothetical protein PGTG_21718 [Puccinia graminis f. sp. tritici CRL 75-36-700-3]
MAPLFPTNRIKVWRLNVQHVSESLQSRAGSMYPMSRHVGQDFVQFSQLYGNSVIFTPWRSQLEDVLAIQGVQEASS